jgi:hypothetical protein
MGDEAIQIGISALDCFAPLAMTKAHISGASGGEKMLLR